MYGRGDSNYDHIVMQELKAAIRQPEANFLRQQRMVGHYTVQRTELIAMFEQMAYELRTYVLAEHLGDEKIVETRTEDHECLRFASWWDHWKATYRSRWWMRWRKWQIAYSIEHHPVTARAEINMTRYWAYPEANVPAPEFGDPYRWATTDRVRQFYKTEPLWWSKEQREEQS